MEISPDDLKLLAGTFLFDEVPRDKRWMRKFMPGYTLGKLLVYYIAFPELAEQMSSVKFVRMFRDHAGVFVQDYYCKFFGYFRKKEKEIEEATKKRDLAKLVELKIDVQKLWTQKVRRAKKPKTPPPVCYYELS